MSRAVISRRLIKFIKDDEESVSSALDDSEREKVMILYHQHKITLNDVIRDYTPEEVRMLCERTKVRVKMYKCNEVWDAKKKFDKQKRLVNKSESFVNRMLVKAHQRRMVKPYSEADIEEYKELAAWQTKRANNIRLNHWRSKAFKFNAYSSSPEFISVDSSSESESEGEAEMPPLAVEPDRAPLESHSQSESEDSSVDVTVSPVIQPAAQITMPDLNSEPNLWGIGDHDEVEEAEGRGESTAAVPQTQLASFDWQQVGNNINSEDLFVHTIVSTQNTEPDYECFGTQVVAASTQDTVESQKFI